MTTWISTVLPNVAKALLPHRIQFRIRYHRNFLRTYRPILRLIQGLVQPQMESVDVGANLGFFTEYLARKSSHVIAFEPNSQIFDEMRRNCRRNVTPVNAALGSCRGSAILRVPLTQTGDARHALGSLANNRIGNKNTLEQSVQVQQLDQLLTRNIGFVKIDVEGFEDDVLVGGIELLRQRHPHILIEIEQRQRTESVDKAFQFLAALDYKGFFMWKGRVCEIQEFDVHTHQNTGMASDYVSDFLFTTTHNLVGKCQI